MEVVKSCTFSVPLCNMPMFGVIIGVQVCWNAPIGNKASKQFKSILHWNSK